MHTSSKLLKIYYKCSLFLEESQKDAISMKVSLCKRLIDALMESLESLSSALIGDIQNLVKAKEKEVRLIQQEVKQLIQKSENQEDSKEFKWAQQIADYEAKLNFTNDGFAFRAEKTMEKVTLILRERLNREIKKIVGIQESDYEFKQRMIERANSVKVNRSKEMKEEEQKIEQHFGPSLLNNLDAMYLKAKVLQFTEKYEAAEKEFVKIIEINEMMRGADHLKTITAIYEYAVTLAGMQRYEEAQSIFKDIVLKRAELRGESELDTLEWKRNMSKIMRHPYNQQDRCLKKKANKFSLPSIQASH